MKIRRYFFSEFSTKKKSYNLLLAKLQWLFLKNSAVFTYPVKLTICPGNVCNLSCALCPTGQNDKNREKGLLEFDLFRKIMDECGPYLFELFLFNWGEPLLNTDIFEMVRYAKKFNIEVTISSNLKHFNEKICSELIKSGLDELIVTLEGASQDTVTRYQIGNNFEDIIANMNKLVAYRNEKKSEVPVISWRYHVSQYNEHEIDKAKELSGRIGIDRLSLNKIRCDMGTELLLPKGDQFKNVEEWLPKNESYSRYDYTKKEKKKIKSNRCDKLWIESTINWNGSVSPCCAVWPEKYDFGNVRNASFRTIWNSPKYQEARKIIRRGGDQSTDNICNICASNQAII